MIIIADSSPLVALATCHSLWLLDKLFEQVKVPPAVFQEVSIPDKPQAEILQSYLMQKVTEVELNNYSLNQIQGLGQGELEAMRLYLQLTADFLLIDDAKAKKAAFANCMEVIGSLGVLRLAKQQGLIKEVKPLIEIIATNNIYLGKAIIAKVLQSVNES
jgi:hypothetical protein